MPECRQSTDARSARGSEAPPQAPAAKISNKLHRRCRCRRSPKPQTKGCRGRYPMMSARNRMVTLGGPARRPYPARALPRRSPVEVLPAVDVPLRLPQCRVQRAQLLTRQLRPLQDAAQDGGCSLIGGGWPGAPGRPHPVTAQLRGRSCLAGHVAHRQILRRSHRDHAREGAPRSPRGSVGGADGSIRT
eukprot:scaffold10253_cov124-Isochrysis_galbana.AAC.29